jgi:hypothetical protein
VFSIVIILINEGIHKRKKISLVLIKACLDSWFNMLIYSKVFFCFTLIVELTHLLANLIGISPINTFPVGLPE